MIAIVMCTAAARRMCFFWVSVSGLLGFLLTSIQIAKNVKRVIKMYTHGFKTVEIGNQPFAASKTVTKVGATLSQPLTVLKYSRTPCNALDGAVAGTICYRIPAL